MAEINAGLGLIDWREIETKATLRKRSKRMEMQTLLMLMQKVDNATEVLIEVNDDKLRLTPHRLAIYGGYYVRKVFVNCNGGLEVELEGVMV